MYYAYKNTVFIPFINSTKYPYLSGHDILWCQFSFSNSNIPYHEYVDEFYGEPGFSFYNNLSTATDANVFYNLYMAVRSNTPVPLIEV